ncbi:hypothetical protein [Staphylococcus aureus]|uniref:hypothetical protein n=1 Tax=Staphylococcus aureus TaxID=1280 RepID=UPI000451244E|nr:hypothetical protein [Staphylococcus aureus]EWW26593.1 hypothetical protein V275_02754 [Staphylococcus aureus W65910]EYL27347.1 hypothetical protein V668_02740 [Staphylococcus aureus F38211]
MPSAYNRKAKVINLNLTLEEYEKIKQLAEIRHLNPTSYTKLTALGNRIKPTVIEKTNIQNDSNGVNEQLKKDDAALKSDSQALQQRIDYLEGVLEDVKEENEVFHRLLEYFDSTAFMNFNMYRNDRQLKNAIKRLKEKYKESD